MRIKTLFIVLITLAYALDVRSQYIDVTNDQFGEAIFNEGTIYGNGVSYFDFNQDGWDDVSIADGANAPRFFLNNEGQLNEIDLGITNPDGTQVIMILWSDYDNDGDQDLLITRDGSPIQLWNNNGSLQMTNVAWEAGLEQLYLKYWGAAFADYDHDGCLDLCVVKYYSSSNFPGDEYRSLLYHNNCDGTFTEVTQAVGIDLPPRTAFQPVFADYNQDGWEDLIFIIDRVQFPNEIYRNNGDGTFTNQSAETGFDLGICAMSGSIADFDHDLDDDVYISNGPNGNLLMRNESGISFTEVAQEYGIATNQVCWGGLWIDYDNNSWEDLFIGATYAAITPLGNWFYINEEGSGFTDGIAEVALDVSIIETFAAAKDDLNNDGYYDMALSNDDAYYARLFQNNGGDHHFLSVELEGVFANRNGIGSRIICYAGGQILHRFTHHGENYISQDSGKEIFGLGDTNLVDSLVVEWNSGTRDVFFNLDADQMLHVREGDSFIDYPNLTWQGDTILCAGDSIVLYAGDYDQLIWNTGDTTTWLTVTEEGYYFADVTDDFLNVWRTDSIYIVVEPIADAPIITTPFSCHFSHDGMATLDIVESDVQQITWDNGVQNISATFWGPGLHSCVWVDIFGCTHEQSFELIAPSQITMDIETTNVTCYGGSDGTCEVIAYNGTPPYEYYLEGPPNQQWAGKHYATAIDANGCIQSYVYFIWQPPPLIINLTTDDIECAGNGYGSAVADVSGGVAPYDVDWNGENPAVLEAGDYTIFVTDHNGCSAFEEYSILQADSFVVEIEVQDVWCYGDDNGAVSAFSLEDITFTWDVEDTTALTAGIHTLMASNALGCVQEYQFEVQQPDELICTVTTTPFIGFTVPGTAVATVTGGMPDYSFQWSNSPEQDSSVMLLSSGEQWLYVEDDYGCSCYTEFYVDFIESVHEHNSQVNISPNPADSYVLISGIQSPVRILVYDASGKMLYEKENVVSALRIETNTWSKGSYVIEIRDDGKTYRSKFLITH